MKTLLDFKAHQSNDASAERLLGNLANHVNVIGDPSINERSLHELVKNRSAIFRRELPDTFKGLLRTMLSSDAKGRLIDTNTARILKSNSLITDADVKNAKSVKRVGEQVLPSELAAFFTRTGEILPGGRSATWTLSNFLTQLSKDYPRSSPTETQWKSLAYVVRQVSNGRFGSRINSEFQRNGQEINTKNAGNFKKKITSPSYRPTMGAGVSMEAGYSKGGHDRNYSEFLVQAKNMLKVCQINALHEAVGQMQERQEILSKAPRLSQHLPGEVAWRAPGGWEGASNPQHQQWLELRRAIDTNAFEKRQRSRDAEDGEMTYALLACAGVNQMVTRLINCSRGNAPYDDNENALASRVANCLAPILGINDTPESAARSVLCNLSAAAEGHRKLLPPEWNGRFPERYVTTGVNVAARILHQTAILQIRLPGCQPVEDFHLYQTRKIRFSWDERANFITAQVVDHSDWMCSTREPQVAEDARFARGRF